MFKGGLAGLHVFQVHRRPKVGVLSTGDEIVEPSTQKLAPGQIRDANRAMLVAACQQAGAEVLDLGIARDTEGHVEACLDKAVSQQVDVLITTGQHYPMLTRSIRLQSISLLCSLASCIHTAFAHSLMRCGLYLCERKGCCGTYSLAVAHRRGLNGGQGFHQASLGAARQGVLWQGEDEARQAPHLCHHPAPLLQVQLLCPPHLVHLALLPGMLVDPTRARITCMHDSAYAETELTERQ